MVEKLETRIFSAARAGSNAANITDGLDGLAAGLSAIAFGTLAIFAYLIGRVDATRYLGLFYLQHSGELTVFCMAMVGALIGFLLFRVADIIKPYPANKLEALHGGFGAIESL